MKYILIFSLMLFLSAQASIFGNSANMKYYGLQMQLQNMQRQAAIQRAKSYRNPTRNIKYPNAYSQYPNIENYHPQRISRNQRYSSTYYEKYYK